MGFFRAQWRGAVVVGLVSLPVAGCATGDAKDSFGAVTFGGVDADDDIGTTGDEAGGKTGPVAESTGLPDIDLDAATTGGFDESTSDDADPTDGTGASDGGVDSVDAGDSSTGGPPMDPPEPWYAPCDDTVTCEGGMCVNVVIDEVMVSSYCSSLCANPQTDCLVPGSVTADPVCIVAAPHVVCGLECTGGKSCPAGMDCYSVLGGDFCF
jgi:hypothetical protein